MDTVDSGLFPQVRIFTHATLEYLFIKLDCGLLLDAQARFSPMFNFKPTLLDAMIHVLKAIKHFSQLHAAGNTGKSSGLVWALIEVMHKAWQYASE